MTPLSIFKKDHQGTAAIEFAILAPVFIMLLLSLIAYGIYLAAFHAVEQITADAARTAVAGLTASERTSLVTQYVATTTLKHPLLDPAKLKVAVATDKTNSNQFTVTTEYDTSNLPIWDLFAFPLPNKTIRSYSTVRMGGL